MAIRVLLLLVGVVALGAIDARAANAPLALDPPGGESREDLFSSRPGNAVPVASPASTPMLAPPRASAPASASPQAPASAPRVTGGNPLWAIPFTSLTATRERPLFAPSRRPPPPAPVTTPVAAPPPPPPPKPPEPETPPLTLVGTVAGTRLAAGVGLFVDSATKAVVSLKAGENHKGWTLRAVRPRQVELAKGLDSAVLDLPPPDMKPGPAAPMLAAPAAMPRPPGPASPGMQANTARVPPAPAVPPGTFGPQPVVQPPPPRPPGPFDRQDFAKSRQQQR